MFIENINDFRADAILFGGVYGSYIFYMLLRNLQKVLPKLWILLMFFFFSDTLETVYTISILRPIHKICSKCTNDSLIDNISRQNLVSSSRSSISRNGHQVEVTQVRAEEVSLYNPGKCVYLYIAVFVTVMQMSFSFCIRNNYWQVSRLR